MERPRQPNPLRPPTDIGPRTKYPKVSLTVWTAIQAALSGSCVGTIRSKHASHGTQHNRRTIRVARPAFRCPLGPVRHRPAEVRRVRARPRGRVIPEPRKTNHPRRHYYSEASPTTAVLTYGTGPRSSQRRHWLPRSGGPINLAEEWTHLAGG